MAESVAINISRRSKRPPGVWIIAVIYLSSAGYTLLSYLLLYLGPLPIEQRAYVDSLSSFDKLLTILIALFNLGGALSILRLKRIAFQLFLLSLFTALLMFVMHAWTTGFEAFGGAKALGLMLSIFASLVVAYYAGRLIERGILK